MLKKLLGLTLISFIATHTIAQVPMSCPAGTIEPAETCQDACIACGVSSYVGSTAGWGGDPEPQGWCSDVQNDQWIGFIAGATTATFSITPSNCTGGAGVQAAVYPAGCNDSPLACNEGCNSCGTTVTSFTVNNMTIGSNYYLIIDGFGADQCDFTVSVTPASATQPPPVGLVPQLSGPATACPGTTANFSLPNTVNGAGFYTWSSPNPNVLFNGMSGPLDLEAPGGTSVAVTFPDDFTGNIQICVQPRNACNTGTQRCRTVNVQNLPPITLPREFVCFEDAFDFSSPWGDALPSILPGNYTLTTSNTTPENCVQTTQLPVTVLPEIKTNLGVRYICSGNCETICGEQVCDPGVTETTCTSFRGCDSTVTVDLRILNPIAEITGPTVLSCLTPSITLGSVASPAQPAPSIKQWRNVATGQLTNAETLVVTTPGTYILRTQMTVGSLVCTKFDTVVVTGNTTPPTATSQNAFIGCGSTTATLNVNTNATTPTYNWSGPPGANFSQSAAPVVGAGGVYTVTVTNTVTGCTATATTTVTGNTTAPSAAANAAVITCTNATLALTASSNVTTATFNWSGPNGYIGTGATATPVINTAGNYVVTVTDPANGCTSTALAAITESITAPGVTATVSGLIGCNTPSVNLNANSPIGTINYTWTGTNGYSATGASPSVSNAGTYVVTAQNTANGCTSTGSVSVSGDTNLPNASTTGGTLSCAVTNITLTGNSTTPGATYSWAAQSTPGTIISNSANAIVNATGTYVLTVTASNGCTQTSTAVAGGDFAAPTASATGGTISCSASSVQINGSSTTPNVTYSWVGPGGTPYNGASVSVNSIGDYQLIVTSQNGCTQTATAAVLPDANLPNAVALGDTINCTNTSATISGSSSTAGVNTSWQFNGNPLPNNALTQTVTQSGQYTLIVSNPVNGCTAVANAFVTLDTVSPNVSSANSTLTCASPNVQIFATSTSNNVSWLWTDPNGVTYTEQNPFVSVPGNYSIVASTPNGCTNVAVANVAADQNIPVLSTNAATITCAVNSVTINTTVNLPVTYEWTAPGISGVFSTLPSPTVSIAGTYTVVALAGNGCSATASITVAENTTPPDVSATGATITCTNPSVQLSGASTTPGATLLWTDLNQTIANPTVTTTGTYTLRATGPNGCTAIETAMVDENIEVPTIQISTPQTLTCTLQNDTLQTTILTAQTTVQSVAWAGPNGFTSNIATPNINVPGPYTITVTGANGCVATAAATVAQNIQLPNATANGGTLNCTINSLNLNGGSTTANTTFAWSGPNSFTAVVEDPIANINGAYLLTVTGANGCTQTATAQVQIDTISPGASINSDGILTCANTSALLTGSTTTGTTFQWLGTGVGTATTSTVTVDVPGDYTLIVTANNTCTSSATFVQDVDIEQPSISALGGTLDCISGAVQLNGSSMTAGATFSWTGPGLPGTTNVPNPTVTTAGDYLLTVTGPNGCTSSLEATVEANTDAPVAFIQGAGQLTCTTTNIDLVSVINTPNTTYNWILPNGTTSTDSFLVATVPGNYQLVVTADNGCITTPQLNLGQNINPPADLETNSPTLDCNNPSVSLTSSTSTNNVQYLWTSPGGETFTTAEIDVTTPGDYLLVITSNINGCTASITATVATNPEVPEISVVADVLTCSDPSTVLNATSNVGNATYQWQGPGGFTSIQQDPTTDDQGIYTVTVKDPTNGCTATFNILVTADQATPNISTLNDTITCTQSSIQLSGNSTTANVSYLWTGPNGVTYGTQSPTISTPGNYVLQVTAANGCTAVSNALITPDQNIPVVTVTGGELTCIVVTVDLSGSANKPDVDWLWTGPSGFTSVAQNPTVNESGTYTLIATTPNGCSGQASILVTQDVEEPEVVIENPDRLDCSTTQVNLNASVAGGGNNSFQWATANGTILAGSGSATATVSQAGTYDLVVINTLNGCSTVEAVNVEVDPAVPTDIARNVRGVSCFGFTNGSVAIGGVTGGTQPFLFSIDNQPFVSTSAFGGLPPGEHTLRVQDANGCEFETILFVEEPAELVVELGQDTTIRLGDVINLTLDGVVNFPERVVTDQTRLTPAYLDTVLCPTCSGVLAPQYSFDYQLTVADSNGCRASDIRRVIVDRTRRIFIANIFNPSGDGGNEILTVQGGSDVERVKSFRIYDRWGSQVHGAEDFLPGDPAAGWRGTINGKLANPAVFVYMVEVLFKDGETELYSGDVTLNR
jgi:CHU_C Type IX secretion signal domain